MRQTVRPHKEECTGCGACVSVCPKAAITMKPDEEGFLYPAVDASLCVECDLCEKRCPVGKPAAQNKPQAYGAQNKDTGLRRASSSGGVFSAIARDMQKKGGVVFGAAFDEKLCVEHIGAFDENELSSLRGSKYVQSDAAEAIANAAALLARGIPVLFSGTPCQIAGLKAKLGGKYDELLLTVDIVCHGVPSPGVFASYLQKLEEEKGQRVVSYAFRDKRYGWKDFHAVATFEDGSEHAGSQVTDPFLYGFLQNLYLRPSCVRCEDYRGGGHAADITLADLWGAQKVCPDHDDDTGLSLVLVNTQKGKKALESCGAQITSFPVKVDEELTRQNPSLVRAVKAHEKRAKFFAYYKNHGFDSAYVMKLLTGPGKAERIVRRIAHLPFGLWRRIRVLLGGK